MPRAQRQDPIDIAAGARMRELRQERRLTQGTLGKALGVSYQRVQKYESGRNRLSVSMLVQVAAALGTTAGALIGEDGAAAADRVIPGEIAMLLASEGAPELLAGFARIRDGEKRRTLIAMAEALGRP
jgi:transcriptional regulator with XRE-family HTH domain